MITYCLAIGVEIIVGEHKFVKINTVYYGYSYMCMHVCLFTVQQVFAALSMSKVGGGMCLPHSSYMLINMHTYMYMHVVIICTCTCMNV